MPMRQLSDGQKAGIVVAKLAMDKPHGDAGRAHQSLQVQCAMQTLKTACWGGFIHSNDSCPSDEAILTGGFVRAGTWRCSTRCQNDQ